MKRHRGTYVKWNPPGPVHGSRRSQNCVCGRWLPKGDTCRRCLDTWRASLVLMALLIGLLVARGMV